MKKIMAAIALSVALSAQAATPTFAQIEQAMLVQDYSAAKVMMEEVIRKRPESVRAHTLKAKLLAETGAPQEEVAKELSYVTALKSKDNSVIVSPQEQHNTLRNILIALCVLGVAITCFLGRWYVNIRSRNKTDNTENDPSNYTTALTTHNV